MDSVLPYRCSVAGNPAVGTAEDILVADIVPVVVLTSALQYFVQRFLQLLLVSPALAQLTVGSSSARHVEYVYSPQHRQTSGSGFGGIVPGAKNEDAAAACRQPSMLYEST